MAPQYPPPFSFPPYYSQEPYYSQYDPNYTGDPNYTLGRQLPPATSSSSSPATTTVTDSGGFTPTVTPFAEQSGSPTSYHSHHTDDPPPQNLNGSGPHHSLSSGIMAAAGVIATIIFILALLGLCVFLLRRHRKAKAKAQAQVADANGQQMLQSLGASNVVDQRAHLKASGPAPLPIIMTSTSSSAASSQQSVPQVAPPIILSTTMDHSYFTGIETDHISLADNRSTRTADTDEPPPPYRPRSVPPISRESSVHISNGQLPNYMPSNPVILSRTEESIHNPFDDDDDDDAISEIEDGTTLASRNNDHLSIVSDLSYQQEPTITHSTV